MLAWLPIVIAASLTMSACVGADSSSSHRDPGKVDAQVFGDVVERFLPLPSTDSQERARRIQNFTKNLGSAECGEAPVPLDYVDDTAGIQFADLELIRERGLGSIYDPEKYYDRPAPDGSNGSAASLRCQAAQQICQAAVEDAESPAARECRAAEKRARPVTSSAAYAELYDGAVNVAITWQDETILTVANTEAVLREAKPMAQCLRTGSGLEVTDTDPSTSFLGATDVAYFSVGSTVTKETMWDWSRLYADCAAPYFEVFERELEKVRPALIERHREALEAFAGRLVELGYVP